MDNAIKVYIADVQELQDSILFQKLYNQVSAQRRAKIDKMKCDKDKRLSLGAGYLLEHALAKEGVLDFTMATENNCKPCLANYSDIKFNISHSGTKVMCVISAQDIGCDVEKVKEMKMGVAKRFFCQEEYSAIMVNEDQERRIDMFYRYWTLKESFMKITGLGFQLPTNEFCIILNEDNIEVIQNVDNKTYYFKEIDLNDGYKYSLCSVKNPILEIEKVVSFNSIFDKKYH